MSVNLNDILIKHWILFDYDVGDSVLFMNPHHLFKIEDSIHYKALLSGDYKIYNKLIKSTKQAEHSEPLFKELKNNFNKLRLNKNKIKVIYNNNLKKYIIQDGCHRISVIKANGLDKNNTIPKDWLLIL